MINVSYQGWSTLKSNKVDWLRKDEIAFDFWCIWCNVFQPLNAESYLGKGNQNIFISSISIIIVNIMMAYVLKTYTRGREWTS